MQSRTRAYLQMHTAVLLYGLTGILGDLITLPKPTLVWWRMLLAASFFLFWPGLFKSLRQLKRRQFLTLFGIGGIVAFHWVTFFGAIALTNVSVTLAVMATVAFFTSMLEPLLLGTRFKWYEAALGLLVIPGVGLIWKSSDFEFTGILVALLSSILAALFSTLNKRQVEKNEPITMTFIQLGSGWLILSLIAPIYYNFVPDLRFLPNSSDLLYLGILAFACTSFAFVIVLQAMRVLSAFSANLTINLEPVYTIVLAAVILKEHQELHWGFYLGAGIIIGAVFSHPFLNRRFGT